MQVSVHEYVSRGDLAGLKRSLGAGVDPLSPNEAGLPPIHLAREWAVIELLLGHGVPVDLQSVDGLTRLHLAGLLAEPDITTQLIAHGADSFICHPEMGTPLHAAAWSYATETGRTETIDILLAHGLSPNQVDTLGRTPLHRSLSAWHDLHDPLVQIAFPAQLNRQVDLTERVRHLWPIVLRTAAHLVARGADPMLRDAQGRRCVDDLAGDDPMMAVLAGRPL